MLTQDVTYQRARARKTVRSWSGNSDPQIVSAVMDIVREELDGVVVHKAFYTELENDLAGGDRVGAFLRIDGLPVRQYRSWAEPLVFGWRLSCIVAAITFALVMGTWLAVGCVDATVCVRKATTAERAWRCVEHPGAKGWP